MANAVISIIKGGLGNQLFIYAAGRAFSLRTGREFHVDTIRGFTDDSYGRTYRLNHFPIKARTMPEEWRVAAKLRHPRHKLIRALNKLVPRDCRTYLAEKSCLGVGQLLDRKPHAKGVTLSGYWQDERYFADYAEEIREELCPPMPSDEANLVLGHSLKESQSVGIHIRRVRYRDKLDAGYYQAAVARFITGSSRPRFVIFGDDLQWALERISFDGGSVETVSHNAGDEIADLWLMTRCRHFIAANSSFSWWGAWLGKQEEGRVVCFPEAPAWPIRSGFGWQSIPNLIETETTS